MHASLSSTRSFLSSRGKFKSLHRRKTSTESTSTTKSTLRSDSQASSRPISRSDRRPEAYGRPTLQPPTGPLPDRPSTQPQSSSEINGNPSSKAAAAAAAAANATTNQWNQASYQQFTEAQSEKQFVSTNDSGEASEPRTSEETMKEVRVQLKPFQGLEYPSDLGLNKGLIDDDILKTAFGITMSRGASADGFKTDIRSQDMVKVQMQRDASNPNDVYEMDVPVQALKAHMPELAVDIPAQTAAGTRVVHQGSLSSVPQSAVSALSPMSELRSPNMGTGGSTHLSVMSPLEASQVPAPRRRFSNVSARGMASNSSANNMNSGDRRIMASGMPSANSMSSHGTSEAKSTGYSYESPRSSMSSVNSATGEEKFDGDEDAEIVEASPLRLDTTSLYHEALATRRPSRQASRQPSRQQSRATSPSFQTSPQRPMIHRTGSNTSLRSTMTNADFNKPLPPEPKRLSTISSQPSEGSTPSRTSSTTVRQPVQQPPVQRGGQFVPVAAVRAIDVGQRMDSTRSSTSGASLRSKYTPKDLDALDDAFLQRNPPNKSRLPNIKSPPQHSPLYMPHQLASPNRSQASFANDLGLGIISEEPLRDYRQGSVPSDVLQVSRGPMRMQPSRRAPQPPSASQSNMSLSPPEQPRLTKRSQSSTHIGSQYREQLDIPTPQRSTTMMVGSSSKADRILGKSPATDRGGQRQDIRFDPQYLHGSSAAQQTANPEESASSSRQSSRDETLGPDVERSPADAHFDEIRRRLEILSPNADPSATYQAYYQRKGHRTSDALRSEDANSLAREIRMHTVRAAELSREADYQREESRPTPQPQTHSQLRPQQQYRPQSFIAELEAPFYPTHQQALQRVIQQPMAQAPVELAGSDVPHLHELGLPSPRPLSNYPNVPIPPEPPLNDTPPGMVSKRGRANQSNPQSSLSVKSRSLHSQGSQRVRSLASLAASDIPDIYAQLGSSQTSQRPSMTTSMTAEEIEMLVSADTAEVVLLRILQNLDNFGDLFAAARVSRGFYRTFKRHEISLLKLALYRMSPAAWELREMSIPYDKREAGTDEYTPQMYFGYYVRDMMTMIELKALILDNCKSFLRHDTLLGLAGESDRASGFDEAFWRIWSFCRIFGCGQGREDDILGQMDWLRGGVLAKESGNTNTLAMQDEIASHSVLYNPPSGFAVGNGEYGLSAEELYDMFELWTCLGVLLQGYQGARSQARSFGVFKRSNVLQGDTERENILIEEWTYHLLANAPSTILDVASFSQPTDELFAHAQLSGHTEWIPPPEGTSRQTFLKEAVSRVYEEKMALIRPRPSPSPLGFSSLPQVVTPPSDTASSPDPFAANRERIAAHGAEIRARRQEPTYRTIPVSPDRPMSNFNEVLSRLERLNTNGEDPDAPEIPKMPSLASRFSRRKPKNKPSVKPSFDESSLGDSAESSPVTRKEPKGNRKASLRERMTGRQSPSSSSERIRPAFVASPLQRSLERLPQSSQDSSLHVPTGPQVRDPVDIAVERLVQMGFDETKARKALADSDLGDRIDVEKATQLLIKQKKKAARKAERLALLETMG